jgi:uncharacterized membrane protein
MFSKLFARDYSKVFAVMAIGAALGLLASFVLSVEAVELAKNANAVLPCDINAALSCGTVGKHETASIFGFPNAFIGIISFSIMLTVAMAGLMGAKLPKLFMYLAWVGAVVGLVFATWMFLVSFMVIGTLCPWCLATDVATLAVLWALTRYNVLENNIYAPKKLQKKLVNTVKNNYDTFIFVAAGFVAILAIVIKFGNELF